MQQLTNRNRILVFFIGFFFGCVVLSFIHSNKRAASEERQAKRIEGLPGVVQFYANIGAPLDGPFVLEENEPEPADANGLQRRVLWIGSKDRLEIVRIEEWIEGSIGEGAILREWQASRPDALWLWLKPGEDETAIVQWINSNDMLVERRDRETNAYLVSFAAGDVDTVDRHLQLLAEKEGVERVSPVVISGTLTEVDSTE